MPIAGTPYTLMYSSDRMPGRKEAYRLDIPLSGSARELLPQLVVSPSALIFPNTLIGDVAMGTVTISNGGEADLVITAIGSAASPVDAPFVLISEDCTIAAIGPGRYRATWFTLTCGGGRASKKQIILPKSSKLF